MTAPQPGQSETFSLMMRLTAEVAILHQLLQPAAMRTATASETSKQAWSSLVSQHWGAIADLFEEFSK